MATIKFYGNLPDNAGNTYIDHQNSGIGFFGGAFGLSVPVGSYQDSTWITDEFGEDNTDVTLSNTKYVSDTQMKYNTLNAQDLNTAPDYFAPLNIRFEHDEAVRVKNCQLRIFDKIDITKNASGVTTQVYEIRHPEVSQDANLALSHRGKPGAASPHEWEDFGYVDGLPNEVTALDLTWSPGMSGLNGNDSDSNYNGGATRLPNFSADASFEAEGHESEQHDWYIAISASPEEIGSKTDFGLYFTLEYL